MKKLLIAALIIAAATTTAFAGIADVNNKSALHFKSKFTKAANVNWTSDINYDKVTFTTDGQLVSVFYTPQGHLIGTSTNIGFDKLPKKAITAITSQYTYPEYNLKECIRFENADGDVQYFVSMDKDGEYIAFEADETGAISVLKK